VVDYCSTMATPPSADAFRKALVSEGVTVKDVRSWRTHNRNHTGAWGPLNGVMIHHTVTSGTQRSIDICYNGYTSLPGPLCHGVIDKDGTVYLVGWGRANHAGGGDPDVLEAVIAENYGDRPPSTDKTNSEAGSVDGNARFYGFECVNLGNGTDPWPAAQLEAIERVGAALCRLHGWTAKSVIGHLEWQQGKIDPRGFSMVDMRKRIAGRLGKPAGGTPSTTPSTPTEYKYHVVNEDETVASIAALHKTAVERLVWLNGIDDKRTIKIGQKLKY